MSASQKISFMLEMFTFHDHLKIFHQFQGFEIDRIGSKLQNAYKRYTRMLFDFEYFDRKYKHNRFQSINGKSLLTISNLLRPSQAS